MRKSCTVALLLAILVMALPLTAADAPVAAVLAAEDRYSIRDTQLVMAQAHIDRLQAEARVKASEEKLGQLIQSLKTKYACLDCTLNADFTWTPASTPSAKVAPSGSTTPTSKKRGGTNQKKE